MKLNIENASKIFSTLNHILQIEMSGVLKYTHYSLMITGHSRIPIVKWMDDQAQESLLHAKQAGEWLTHFEQHPTLNVSHIDETHRHRIDDILKESLEHEHQGLKLYYQLLDLSKDQSVILEEYARKLIVEEESHIGEVEKMLRKL